MLKKELPQSHKLNNYSNLSFQGFDKAGMIEVFFLNFIQVWKLAIINWKGRNMEAWCLVKKASTYKGRSDGRKKDCL